MTTENFQALVKGVLASSVSKIWAAAVLEWTVVGLEEDPSGQGVCVCGQSNLVKLFTIENEQNGESLFPIGSTCVNQFGVKDLDVQVNLFLELHALRSAAMDPKQNVELTSEFFSKALLKHLHAEGVFTPDRYNDMDGDGDYEFLLKMFNKRKKDDITSGQRAKIRVLLRTKIIPFIEDDERLK